MKGFFTQNRYFLLPPDCLDTENMLGKYGGRRLAVTELLEEKCMAPYFVAEYAKQVEITLGEYVYPCDVQVLSMKEYNDRLRAIIPSHCVGCPNYGGIDKTDESLDGHHEEIALDRVCFYRAQSEAAQVQSEIFDYYQVDEWIRRFALRFYSLNLEAMIDRGEFLSATDAFCETLFEIVHCVIPPVWVRKNNEKYELFCTTFTDEHDGLVMEHIFTRLTELCGNTWNFYNYIPKGVYVPEAIKPLGVIARFMQNVEPSLEMTIYAKKGYINETYYWLCMTLGERELQKLATPLNVIEAESEDELPEEAADADTLAELFEELLPQISYDEMRAPASHVIFFSPNIDDIDASEEEILSDGKLYSFRTSYLCDRFVMPLELREPLMNIWEDCGIVTELCLPIARFVFTKSPLCASRSADAAGERFMRETEALFDYLSKCGLFLLFAQVTGDGTSEQFGLVLNHTEFLYAVRYMAPFFMKYPAELYLYTASHRGGGHYKLGFEMKLLEEETLLWSDI